MVSGGLVATDLDASTVDLDLIGARLTLDGIFTVTGLIPIVR